METKFIKKAGFYLYSDAEGAKLNILVKTFWECREAFTKVLLSEG